MFRKTAVATAALALSLGAFAAPAHSWDLIDWNGTQVWGEAWTPTTTLSWNQSSTNVWYRIYFEGYTDAYQNGNEVLPGLASTVLYRLTEVKDAGKTWQFEYLVENASVDPVTESRVTAIGFDVNQTLKSVSLAPGGEYRTVGRGDFDPVNNYLIDDDFDVCFTTKGSFYGSPTNSSSNCDPGSNAGPELGESGSGMFTLKFYSSKSTVGFRNPFVAYDGIEFNDPGARTTTYGKYYDYKGHKHGKGCGHDSDDSGYGLPVAWVPEPSTWALMIIGFGGAGVALRSRRRAIAA
ncbi:cistern family PEP-CTERM protein [Phenylobacterium kunshanense]|uniref:Ice-binding protein C-terminal domain-containing protein n=1 Tax=Phenylobacterium kunshanense TaxID=1445034 RepID=A0A328BKK4_9CAUL|nr:cistern family PEP-CTERM protein [Phenylobacterium kunshanense]RAK67497.1 hypothetical protein DJ019_06195 [Phenylobacterium kunshanense]